MSIFSIILGQCGLSGDVEKELSLELQATSGVYRLKKHIHQSCHTRVHTHTHTYIDTHTSTRTHAYTHSV